jgi:hypothetical protein
MYVYVFFFAKYVEACVLCEFSSGSATQETILSFCSRSEDTCGFGFISLIGVTDTSSSNPMSYGFCSPVDISLCTSCVSPLSYGRKWGLGTASRTQQKENSRARNKINWNMTALNTVLEAGFSSADSYKRTSYKIYCFTCFSVFILQNGLIVLYNDSISLYVCFSVSQSH